MSTLRLRKLKNPLTRRVSWKADFIPNLRKQIRLVAQKHRDMRIIGLKTRAALFTSLQIPCSEIIVFSFKFGAIHMQDRATFSIQPLRALVYLFMLVIGPVFMAHAEDKLALPKTISEL